MSSTAWYDVAMTSPFSIEEHMSHLGFRMYPTFTQIHILRSLFAAP
jgi:hypothetical protein